VVGNDGGNCAMMEISVLLLKVVMVIAMVIRYIYVVSKSGFQLSVGKPKAK